MIAAMAKIKSNVCHLFLLPDVSLTMDDPLFCKDCSLPLYD